MGFDIHGVKPTEVEHYDNFKKEEVVTGEYFRANVWYWRPLWTYICRTCDDILTEDDMEAGEYNDAHIISKSKAKRIATRLRKLDKNGYTMNYEKSYYEGAREAQEKVGHYPFESQVVFEFAEFCKESGGFEIC